MNEKRVALVLVAVFILSGLYVAEKAPTMPATGPAGFPGNAHLRPLVGPQCASPYSNTSLTITNSQAWSTGYYQQHFYLDAALFPSLTANLSNLEFVYANGTLINAWIENNDSSASTAANVWLEQDSIPANSARTIYMLVCTASVFSESGPTGLNASLTGTYGAYDDGWRVFNVYANWSGTSTPTGWSHSTTCHSYSVSNGVTYSTTASSGFCVIAFATPQAWSNQSWIEAYTVTSNVNGNPSDGICFASNALTTSGCTATYTLINGGVFLGPTVTNFGPTPKANTYYLLANGQCPSNYACSGSNRVWSQVNYTFTNAVIGGSHGTGSNGYVKIEQWAGSTVATSTDLWVRSRTLEYAMPVMAGPGPSAPVSLSFSSITTSAFTASWTNPAGSLAANNFYYGTTCGSLSALGGTGVRTTQAVTSLTGATTYCMKITASNSNGTGAALWGNETTLPNAPTVLTSSSVTTTSFLVTWNNPTGTLTGVTVLFGTVCRTLPNVVGGSAVRTSQAINSLAPNTIFCVEVYASSAGGNSSGAWGNISTLPNPPGTQGNAPGGSSPGCTLPGGCVQLPGNVTVNPSQDQLRNAAIGIGAAVVIGLGIIYARRRRR